MARKTPVRAPGRRQFFKQVAVLGGAVAIGSVAGGTAAEPAPEEEAQREAKGYHLTPHIATYYSKARI